MMLCTSSRVANATPEPVVATQLNYIARFCTPSFDSSVLTVDPTFCLGDFDVTLITTRHQFCQSSSVFTFLMHMMTNATFGMELP